MLHDPSICARETRRGLTQMAIVSDNFQTEQPPYEMLACLSLRHCPFLVLSLLIGTFHTWYVFCAKGIKGMMGWRGLESSSQGLIIRTHPIVWSWPALSLAPTPFATWHWWGWGGIWYRYNKRWFLPQREELHLASGSSCHVDHQGLSTPCYLGVQSTLSTLGLWSQRQWVMKAINDPL